MFVVRTLLSLGVLCVTGQNILDDIKDTLVPELEGLASASSPVYECANEFVHNKEVGRHSPATF